MEQYEKIQQLLKKEPGAKERVPIFPPTVIQAVFDAKTGASLEAILAQFNSITVQYQGSPRDTRNLIPAEMRRPGLTITYTNMDSETITERASSAVQKDNDHWGLDTNWSRIDELSLSGDIAVSATGTWIINGEDTKVKAVGPKGENGITPWLKTIGNKLHFSYDNVIWEPCSDYIAVKFRNFNNRLQISYDEGKKWADISDYIAVKFRNFNNRLQISYDEGKKWADISDPLATYVRFAATSSTAQDGSIGNIQYSHDKATWHDLSPEFRNYLRIQGYVATNDKLPTGVPVGTIYGVGPTYEAGDTFNTNPMYQLRVWDGTQWVNNGYFTSISAGIVQETGDSETEVMSQKAVTKELKQINTYDKDDFDDEEISICDDTGEEIVNINKERVNLKKLEIKSENIIDVSDKDSSDDEISICADNDEELVNINKERVSVKALAIKGENIIDLINGDSKEEISIYTDEGEEVININKDRTIIKNPIIKKGNELINILDYLFQNNNVIDLYKPLLNKAIQLSYDSTDGNHDLGSKNPSFVFFSDIHASTKNLERIIELTNSWADKVNIKAIINGGDSVSSTNDDPVWINTYINYINSCNCDALFAIGNHDAWAGSNWNWDTEENLYNKFNGFTKGVITDKLYYYKDYDSVRLIVLNSGYYWNATQKVWLNNILDNARANKKAVIIVQHYPFRCVVSDESMGTTNNMAEPIKCSFTQVGLPLVTDVAINTLNDDVLECVDTFIRNGGTFICHFAGHTHYDGFYKHKNHPNQAMFITGSANYAKYYHEIKSDDESSRLFDQFNIFSVSTKFGLLKIVRIGANEGFELESKNVIVFDYNNKVIINNY